MRQPKLLDGFTGVAAGGLAVAEVPGGWRYYELLLHYMRGGAKATRAQMITDLTRIEVTIGNRVQREFSATQLIMLNEFSGDTIRDGYLRIKFAEKDRATTKGEDVLAWGTQGLNSKAAIVVKVTIAGGVPTPVLNLWAEVDKVQLPPGDIVKIKTAVLNPAGAGTHPWAPDTERGERIRRIHINDTGQVSAVQVLADNEEEFYGTSDFNTERLAQAGYVKQANWTHIAFDIDKRVLSNLDVIRLDASGQPRRIIGPSFKFTVGAAGPFPIVYEVIGPRD